MNKTVRYGLVAVIVPVVGFAALCGGSALVGSALDGDVDLAVEERVAAPPAAVFDLLDDVDGIAAWWDVAMQAQAGSMPESVTMDVRAAGPVTSGVGTVVDFAVGDAVSETWTILELEPPTRAVYEVDFKLMKVTRTIALTPDGDGTRVQWQETGTIDNPWMRLMGKLSGDVTENFRMAIAALGTAAAADAGGAVPVRP